MLVLADYSLPVGFGGNRPSMTSVLEGCPDGGACFSSTHPEALPLISCGAGKLPRAQKVNPRYAGVDAIRRLVHPEEPKATSQSPRTEIQAVDESGTKKRKAFIASQVGRGGDEETLALRMTF